MKSVKTKIIAIVLCCTILPALAIGIASIINSQRVITDDSTRTMNLLCANRAEEIDALFTRIEQSVETLKVYAVQQIGSLEQFQTDDAYVNEYSQRLLDIAVNAAQNTEGALTVYVRFNPEFTEPESGLFCSRSTSDGSFKALTPTNLALYEPTDREHVGWFYEPAQKKEGTWMSPYFNKNIQVKMISYVVPFYIGSTFVGVVGMDIDFNVLQDIVANTSVYKSGYAFLTDESSKIVYHSELAFETDLTQYNNGEFHEMAQMLQHSQTDNSLVHYTFQGVQKKAAYRILGNNMRLVLTAPVGEIDEQANILILQISIAVLIIASVAVIVTILYSRRLVKPLLELTVAAKKIADGDLSVSITHQSEDEIGALAESFRQTVAHLHKYISYINELAYRDSLTGVKNKTAYLEIVKQMDEATRLKRPQYAVVVFDINNLKAVNDTLGHDFGDMLIINACKIIGKVFKRSPIYRIGGDEFVVLLENSDYDRYTYLLELLENELDEHNRSPQNEQKISIARGIALYSEETDLTYNDVFKRADNAMYRNKEEMKNRGEKNS